MISASLKTQAADPTTHRFGVIEASNERRVPPHLADAGVAAVETPKEKPPAVVALAAAEDPAAAEPAKRTYSCVSMQFTSVNDVMTSFADPCSRLSGTSASTPAPALAAPGAVAAAVEACCGAVAAAVAGVEVREKEKPVAGEGAEEGAAAVVVAAAGVLAGAGVEAAAEGGCVEEAAAAGVVPKREGAGGAAVPAIVVGSKHARA